MDGHDVTNLWSTQLCGFYMGFWEVPRLCRGALEDPGRWGGDPVGCQGFKSIHSTWCLKKTDLNTEWHSNLINVSEGRKKIELYCIIASYFLGGGNRGPIRLDSWLLKSWPLGCSLSPFAWLQACPSAWLTLLPATISLSGNDYCKTCCQEGGVEDNLQTAFVSLEATWIGRDIHET